MGRLNVFSSNWPTQRRTEGTQCGQNICISENIVAQRIACRHQCTARRYNRVDTRRVPSLRKVRFRKLFLRGSACEEIGTFFLLICTFIGLRWHTRVKRLPCKLVKCIFHADVCYDLDIFAKTKRSLDFHAKTRFRRFQLVLTGWNVLQRADFKINGKLNCGRLQNTGFWR